MPRLTFTKETSLILHTEEYNNKGLKQTDIMERIKKEISGVWLVEECCINKNIRVHLEGNSESFANMVFFKINSLLNFMLLEQELNHGK
jgi:hypothetical protein